MADLVANAAIAALLLIEAGMEAAEALGGTGTGTGTTPGVPAFGSSSSPSVKVGPEAPAEITPPAFTLKLNEKEFAPDQALDVALIEVIVKEDVEAPSMFSLHFTGNDASQLVDTPQFDIGSSVEVSFDDKRHKPPAKFTGEITGLEMELTEGGIPSLTVRGYDRRHRLLRNTRTVAYLQKTDSDIAKELIKNYSGLKFVAPTETNPNPVHEVVLQHEQSDFEFLKQRAARIGYELWIDDESLHFRPHPVSEAETVTLKMEELTAFYARMSAANQPDKLVVRGWDPTTNAVIKELATPEPDMGGTPGATVVNGTVFGFGESQVVLVNQPVFTAPEAQKMAKGRLQELALGFISGEGTCNGRTDIKVGKTIALTAISGRFDGRYYVVCVERSFKSGNLVTKFTVRRSATT